MSAPPIRIELTYAERQALEELATQELRRPSEMLRWLLREELNRRDKKHSGTAPNLTGTNGAAVSVAG